MFETTNLRCRRVASEQAQQTCEEKKKEAKEGRGQNTEFHNTVFQLCKQVLALLRKGTLHDLKPVMLTNRGQRLPLIPGSNAFLLHHYIMRNSWANTTARLGGVWRVTQETPVLFHPQQCPPWINEWPERKERILNRVDNRVCLCYSMFVNMTWPVFQLPWFRTHNPHKKREGQRGH